MDSNYLQRSERIGGAFNEGKILKGRIKSLSAFLLPTTVLDTLCACSVKKFMAMFLASQQSGLRSNTTLNKHLLSVKNKYPAMKAKVIVRRLRNTITWLS